MHASRCGLAVAVFAFACGFQHPAQAEECEPLSLLTTVDLVKTENNSAAFVPVSIQGQPDVMLLDTGGTVSMITPQLAAKLGLVRNRSNVRFFNVSHEYSNEYVVTSLVLGRLTADHLELVIKPGDASAANAPPYGGILAPDVLSHYDVDVDFGTGKFNLISPKHCPGKVIYWPASVVAVVPMTLVVSGHIVVPVKLDGHETYAMVDTGAYNTTLTTLSAEGTFGLKLGSAETPAEGSLQDRPDATTYRHTFKTLEFEGITISNPQVVLIPDTTRNLVSETARPDINSHIPNRTRNESQVTMLIGMNVLRHFHIYIAYGEEKLYITPAGQPAVVN